MSFFIKRQIGNTIYVYCVAGTVDPSIVDPNLSLIVYAQYLTISGHISLPGQNVQIYARKIVARDSPSIDVSGKDGSDWPPGFRVDGKQPGYPGRNGSPGGGGSNAGSIWILAESIDGTLALRAVGGSGGRAQDGGNGAKGELGNAGADAPCGKPPYINKRPIAGEPGGQGGIGGTSGAGGVGGDGGNGGRIFVKTLQSVSAAQFTTTADGGASGQNGTNGEPGPGGVGGPGGRNAYFDSGHFLCLHRGRQPDGLTGSSGRVTYSPPKAARGISGTIGIHQTKMEYFAKIADISYLGLLLHQASVDYLRGDYRAVTSTLTWVNDITNEEPRSSIPLDEWSAINASSSAFLAQLAAGLDYYGYPRNFVPLVALPAFEQQINRMLSTATAIESAYSRYFAAKVTAEQRKAALQVALHIAEDNLTDLRRDLASLGELENQIQDNLGSLADALQAQQLALQKAESAFRDAVSRRASCAFEDVLKCMAAMVSIVSAAYGNVVAIVAAASAFSAVSSVKNFVKDLETTIGTINDLKKQVNAFQDALNSNASKIAISQEKLDDLLHQFGDIAEAEQLKAQFDTFAHTCLTRSQKAIDLTGAEVQRVSISSKIQSATSEISRLRGQLATETDPTLPAYVTFLGRLLSDAKQRVVHALYQEHRAYEYWALKDAPFHITSFDMPALQELQNQIRDSAFQAQVERNRPPQSFGTNGANPIRVMLGPTTYSAEFARFKKTGLFTFAIARDHPAFSHGMYAITLRGVVVRVLGIKAKDGIISVNLIHHGRAEFLDPALKLITFSHKPRPTLIIYSQSQGAITDDSVNLGQDGTFAALSPFAAWTIHVRAEENPKLDLTQAAEIHMDFSGFFYPREEAVLSRNSRDLLPLPKKSGEGKTGGRKKVSE